jgi:hypothetical protein
MGGQDATDDQLEGTDSVGPTSLTLEVRAQIVICSTDRITPRVDERGQLQAWLGTGSCLCSGVVTLRLHAEVLECQTRESHVWNLPAAAVPLWMRERSPDPVLQLFRFVCMLHGNFQRFEIVAVRPNVAVRIAGYLAVGGSTFTWLPTKIDRSVKCKSMAHLAEKCATLLMYSKSLRWISSSA